jgi:hypothetical protein
MLTVNQKKTRLFVYAKRVGRSFPLTFQRAALISMNAMPPMDHLECVE